MKKKLKENYPEGYVEYFAIHEAYYNKKGKITSLTLNPVTVQTETHNKSEFNRVLKWMRQAVNKPVIDYETCKEIK